MSEKVKVTVVSGNETNEFEGDFAFGTVVDIGKEEVGMKTFVIGNASKHQICRLISEAVRQVTSNLAEEPMESVFMLEEIIRNIKKASSEALVNEVLKKYCSKEDAENEINKERQEK